MPRKRADKLARSAEPAGIRQLAKFRWSRSDNAVQPRTSVVLSEYLVVSERYLTCEWFLRHAVCCFNRVRDLFFHPSSPGGRDFDAGDAATARTCWHRPIESADSLSEQEHGEDGEHDNGEHDKGEHEEHEEHGHGHEHGEYGQSASHQHDEHEQHKKQAEHPSGGAHDAGRIS